MSTIYTFHQECPSLSALAAADEFLVYDDSTGSTRNVTAALTRAFANNGLTTFSANAAESVTAASHAGHTIVLDRAAGVTVTLPAATGTGNKYLFVVKTTVTSNNYIVKVANATDVMTGTAILFADGGDTAVAFATAASTDTITMSGTATGGVNGARIEVIDIASGLFYVSVVSDASGTEATPFSATVS